jgi:biotin carboxylase
MAVLERAHGVDAVELALRSAGGGRAAAGDPRPARPARKAVAVQLRSTLPPGTAGRVTGRLPQSGRRHGGTSPDVELVAASGYDPGDRLDGWYDALLATVSAGGPDTATAARAAGQALTGLSDVGVPHDGAEGCAVLERLASGNPAPGS